MTKQLPYTCPICDNKGIYKGKKIGRKKFYISCSVCRYGIKFEGDSKS